MSKIFGFYANKLDKTWYDSSSLKYSECEDNENELKTLRVVFNNGTQYQYNKVRVQDYLLFRDSPSAGQGLNKYIKSKGYDYEKLENVSLDAISDELEFRRGDGIFIDYADGHFIIKDAVDKEIFNNEVELNKKTFDTICGALQAVGKSLYVINGIEGENDEIFTENDGSEGED